MNKYISATVCLLFLAMCATVSAQTTVLSPWPVAHFEDNNGLLCAGCKLFTYAAGTTTKQNTYTSSTGGTPNVNPVILNTRGEANIWLTPGLVYKYVLSPATDSDPPANPFWTVDNIVSPGSLGSTTQATFSSLNALYFPTYSQLAGFGGKLSLSGTVSDSAGSFRDTLYVENKDSDQTVYTQPHTNYGGRFASFGPNSAGFLNTYKNIVGLNAYAQAATVGTALSSGFPPGVSGINADAFQFGAGISDNEFAAHNPSAANGGLAQSVSVVGVQGIMDANYADADATHTVYAILASSAAVGNKLATAYYGASGSGNAIAFVQSNGIPVTQNAIVMPHSAGISGNEGSIIDYGRWNGNPAGGSFTQWKSATNGGQYSWVDAGVIIASVDTKFMQLGTTTPVHLAFKQTTPPALTSCGTTPSIAGTDAAGTVTMGTGNPAGCVITFNVPYLAPPTCNVTWRANPLAAQSYTMSTTAITLVQTATSSNIVDYDCKARADG